MLKLLCEMYFRNLYETQVLGISNDPSVLKYNFWNANGIDERKLNLMMPTWQGSSLIFIQETKLNPSKEQSIRDVMHNFGYGCMFHDAVQGTQNPDWWSYGMCVFFKYGLNVKNIVLKDSCPEIQTCNKERIMVIHVESYLDPDIIFVNLYFPCHDGAKEMSEERERWVTTLEILSAKLKENI